jgi:hypothetical protein
VLSIDRYVIGCFNPHHVGIQMIYFCP